ncbi:phage head closure protein [Rhizobium rhizosphaerae]|nr:phage head closure protein [Xaviernesmea rhizosphaerae]
MIAMLSNLDPGALSARLAWEHPVEAPDGQGGVSIAYQTAGALWSRIEPVQARWEEAGNEAGAERTHRIWLRHRDDLKAGDRLRLGARLFTLLSLHDPDETRRMLVAEARELVS